MPLAIFNISPSLTPAKSVLHVHPVPTLGPGTWPLVHQRGLDHTPPGQPCSGVLSLTLPPDLADFVDFTIPTAGKLHTVLMFSQYLPPSLSIVIDEVND